jgi:RHS repeat-associated protein
MDSSTGPEGALTYTSYNDNELNTVTGARQETYAYDLNGNRTSANGTTYGPPGPGNLLTNDGVYTYAYDNEGNLLTKTKVAGGEQTQYSWDYRNRLTEAVVMNGTTTLQDDRFTYDVFNRRIGKSTLGGSQQWKAYDGANPYADFNGSTLTNRYLYGNAVDQLFARYDGTNTTWYLTDLLGSVRLLTDKNAATILDQLTYDSYGNIATETQPANGDRFKYAGREWDAEIGLYNNRARYYNPTVGRFLKEDPLRFAAGDSNLYRYVHNQPTGATDPSGLNLQPGVNFVRRADRHKKPFGFWDAFDAVDGFFAGWGNTLTFGRLTIARENLWGDAATHNHHGRPFQVGSWVGVGHVSLMGAAGVTAAGTGLAGLASGGASLEAVGGITIGSGGTIGVVVTGEVAVATAATAATAGAIQVAMMSAPPDQPGASSAQPQLTPEQAEALLDEIPGGAFEDALDEAGISNPAVQRGGFAGQPPDIVDRPLVQEALENGGGPGNTRRFLEYIQELLAIMNQ